jgi:hypothetical protein
MKKFLLSIVALMATYTVSAQFSVDPANLKIAAGEEQEVVISLTTEVEVTAYEMWLKCPEGIELVTRLNEDDETEFCVDFEGNRHKSSHSIVSGEKAGEKGLYLISVTSNKNALLRETEGPVLRVKFKATADAEGAIKILDSFAGTPEGVKYPFEDKDFITVNGDAINSISAEQTKSGVIYNMAGQRVSKATKGIFIVDGKKVAVK